MPERLLAAGMTWNVYRRQQRPRPVQPAPLFEAFKDPTSTRGQQLQQPAIAPNYRDGRLMT